MPNSIVPQNKGGKGDRHVERDPRDFDLFVVRERRGQQETHRAERRRSSAAPHVDSV